MRDYEIIMIVLTVIGLLIAVVKINRPSAVPDRTA